MCPPLYRHTESQNCTCRTGFCRASCPNLWGLSTSKDRFSSHQEPPPAATISQRWQRGTSQWQQTAPRAPLGASRLLPWTCVRSVGLTAPCLYRPLCFALTHSAGKGNKCFFTIPFNINLGGQSCEWVQKAIKQSHRIKIHQDCSMLRCWYHHLIPIFIPKIARQSDAEHRKPHNMVTTLLFFSLCICAWSPFLMAYTEKE